MQPKGRIFSMFQCPQDLELCHTSRNPYMGFCIQRTHGIPSDTAALQSLSTTEGRSGIIGGNSFVGIHVVHTSYLVFLQSTFGFQQNPVMLHAVFYQHRPYLGAKVSSFLTQRKELKQLGTTDSLAKANFLKLILNSIYGFCLCR